MKPLAPLSSAAREMLERGSHVEPPTPEQSERMGRSLAPLFESAGGAALGTTVGAARGLSGASRLIAGRWIQGGGVIAGKMIASSGKLLIAVGALAAASGAFWLGRLSTPVAPQAPAPVWVAPPATQAPALLEAPAVSRSEPLEPAAEPPAAMAAALLPPAPPRALAAAQPRAGGLRAGIDRLARADAALRAGRGAEALRLLEPRVVPELREQASALRAIGACQTGLAAAGRGANALLERWPDSPYRARVREACGL